MTDNMSVVVVSRLDKRELGTVVYTRLEDRSGWHWYIPLGKQPSGTVRLAAPTMEHARSVVKRHI